MRTHPLWRPFEQPTDEEIARARVRQHVPAPVEVVAPDPDWPARFGRVRARIAAALGPVALGIEHIGSTSVPGLAAKPVIDVYVDVPDSAEEPAYLPALEAVGFRLTSRQPDWEGHRCLRGTDPAANVHVFSPDATEPRRVLAFRDWLIAHPADRDAYGALKLQLAARRFTDVMHYNNAKAALIYDIYERIFAADPDAAHDPHPRPGQAGSTAW